MWLRFCIKPPSWEGRADDLSSTVRDFLWGILFLNLLFRQHCEGVVQIGLRCSGIHGFVELVLLLWLVVVSCQLKLILIQPVECIRLLFLHDHSYKVAFHCFFKPKFVLVRVNNCGNLTSVDDFFEFSFKYFVQGVLLDVVDDSESDFFAFGIDDC